MRLPLKNSEQQYVGWVRGLGALLGARTSGPHVSGTKLI
jgi:hypothetical protein